jgi:putative transcriptional regulator
MRGLGIMPKPQLRKPLILPCTTAMMATIFSGRNLFLIASLWSFEAKVLNKMSNHPNRGPQGPAANPTPEMIKAARGERTQTQCANVVYTTCRNWQKWEAGDLRMHPAFWELFLLKSGTVQPTN